jgi:ubiquitin thioesterase protein OTUB1
LGVCWPSKVKSDKNITDAVQGPLVGLKKSSHAITEEYAKADPIYVAKTAVSISANLHLHSTSANCIVCKALPQKYSHYRPILGDGNCGWRGKCCP